MGVEFGVDLGEVDRAMTGLLNVGPVLADCEDALDVQYAAGQAAVHVITGSLRGSERATSTYTNGVWQGEVAFGGPSPGKPNDPVDYAVYEMAKGGPHDFRDPIIARSRMYRRALVRHLKRGR